MKLGEKHGIIIEKYPYYESLNVKLKEDYLNANFDLEYKTTVSGKHSDYYTQSPNIDIVTSWIISLVRNHYPYMKKYNLVNGNSWFVGYDVGEYSVEHDHIPWLFSGVYYLNTPKGSSPLVFSTSGKKIKAEEGKVLVFPANMRHHVPKNKCRDRMALIGNLIVKIP